jgi:hypothetical protein
MNTKETESSERAPEPVEALKQRLDFAVERYVTIWNQYGPDDARERALPRVSDAYHSLRTAVIEQLGEGNLGEPVPVNIHQKGKLIVYDPNAGAFYRAEKGRFKGHRIGEQIPEYEWIGRPALVNVASDALTQAVRKR